MSKSNPVRMSLEMALDLGLCGLLVVGMGFLARSLQPDFPRLISVLLLTGGGLCIFWSFVGFFGKPWRLGMLLTVTMVAGLMTYHAVRMWCLSRAGERHESSLPLLLLLLAFICTFTLVNLLRPGKAASL